MRPRRPKQYCLQLVIYIYIYIYIYKHNLEAEDYFNMGRRFLDPKIQNIREFKIYDVTVAKTSLKIASSSFSIYSVIMSVCLTFES